MDPRERFPANRIPGHVEFLFWENLAENDEKKKKRKKKKNNPA